MLKLKVLCPCLYAGLCSTAAKIYSRQAIPLVNLLFIVYFNIYKIKKIHYKSLGIM